jgi:hypothetical protein
MMMLLWFFSLEICKKLPASPMTSVVSVALTLTRALSLTRLSTTSLLSNITPVKKPFLGSPSLPISNVKKAFCVDWLNYHEIRCELSKYTKEHNSSHKSTIEEDFLFLLSRFTAKGIIIAFAVTLSKDFFLILWSQSVSF